MGAPIGLPAILVAQIRCGLGADQSFYGLPIDSWIEACPMANIVGVHMTWTEFVRPDQDSFCEDHEPSKKYFLKMTMDVLRWRSRKDGLFFIVVGQHLAEAAESINCRTEMLKVQTLRRNELLGQMELSFNWGSRRFRTNIGYQRSGLMPKRGWAKWF